MLNLTELIGFGVGGARSITLTESGLLNTDNTGVLTFTAANIGTPEADRVVLVNMPAQRTAAGTTTVACTVGGVSMTQQILLIQGARYHAVFSGVVPSGATGDVVLTFGTGNFSALINIVAASGGFNPTIYDSDTDTTTSPSLTLDIPAAGILLCSHTSNTSGATTWTNATETYEGNLSGSAGTVTCDLDMDAETGRIITVTQSGSAESALVTSFGWS